MSFRMTLSVLEWLSKIFNDTVSLRQLSFFISRWFLYTELICNTTITDLPAELPGTAATLPWGTFSSSETMRQHTVHIRQSTYCNVKLWSSFLRTLGPLNSPDINSVHCQIWGAMQDGVYQMAVMNDLRQHLDWRYGVKALRVNGV